MTLEHIAYNLLPQRAMEKAAREAAQPTSTLEHITYNGELGRVGRQLAMEKAAEAARAVLPPTPPAHGPAVDGGTIPAVVGEVLSQGYQPRRLQLRGRRAPARCSARPCASGQSCGAICHMRPPAACETRRRGGMGVGAVAIRLYYIRGGDRPRTGAGVYLGACGMSPVRCMCSRGLVGHTRGGAIVMIIYVGSLARRRGRGVSSDTPRGISQTKVVDRLAAPRTECSSDPNTYTHPRAAVPEWRVRPTQHANRPSADPSRIVCARRASTYGNTAVQRARTRSWPPLARAAWRGRTAHTHPACAWSPPPPSRVTRARRAPLRTPLRRSRRRLPTRLPAALRPRSAAAKPRPTRLWRHSRRYDCWGHAMLAPITANNDPAATRVWSTVGRAESDGHHLAESSKEAVPPVSARHERLRQAARAVDEELEEAIRRSDGAVTTAA